MIQSIARRYCSSGPSAKASLELGHMNGSYILCLILNISNVVFTEELPPDEALRGTRLPRGGAGRATSGFTTLIYIQRSELAGAGSTSEVGSERRAAGVARQRQCHEAGEELRIRHS